MRNVCYPITASLEYFDFVIVPLDKSAGQTTDKIVGDLIEPVLQGHQEAVKAPKPALVHPLYPAIDRRYRRDFGVGSVKDRRQLLSQLISPLQIRCTFKQQRQLF